MRIDRVAFAVAATRANLNGTQIAEKSGLTRATVSAIKCGKSCTSGTAEKIAAVLGVTVDELLQDPTTKEE